MGELSRALSLWHAGKHLDAEHAVREVLRVTPNDSSALRSLAEICGALGRGTECVGLWRRIVELSPGDSGALRHLAQALLAVNALREAIDALRASIALEPGNSRAHNNLGLALLRDGDAAGAAASLGTAVKLDPSYALAHMNLGLAQQQLNDFTAACSNLRRALDLDPHLSSARLQLSALLSRTDAVAARRERDRALESHAINLMTVRRYDEAIAAWSQLIDTGADIPRLAGMRFHCRLQICDWSHYDTTKAELEAEMRRGRCSDLPFSFFVYSGSAAEQLQCARSYAAELFPAAPPKHRWTLGAGKSNPGPIRIAYVSFDFHEHATAYLIAGLLEEHDRERFEITALSYGQNDGSAMRTRLEAAVDRFIDVSLLSDSEIADLMLGLGIQIAVDLKGFTGGARTGVFALRPAPLQINFLGYPGTLGADYYDYIVADRHVIPEGEEVHYSEQCIYMPDCYQPNDSKRPVPSEAPDRTQLGLPSSGFVFCSFNNLYKLTPLVFELWLRLLRQVPGSVLWLLEGSPAARDNLIRTAATSGVDPQRIIFAPHVPLAQHLARYRHADLFLDTTPCNAHTTASDALWMGVPVVTMTGRTFAGRVATSLLHAAGLSHLCTSNSADYEAKALQLATNPASLAAVKASLECGRSTCSLFDTQAYCRHLEAAYEHIWLRHSRGCDPAPLDLRRDLRRPTPIGA
jgi:protein O-GlcNAc transferase